MSNFTFSSLKAGYAERWHNMDINTNKITLIKAAAKVVIAGKARYKELEAQTNIPWYFIGLLHYRESNCNFHTHLHNGDPLTRRTVHVPAGMPRTGTPPFSFEYSALDALKYMGYDKVTDWGIERIAYCFEKYNGFGYRSQNVNSPYLWAFTNQYARGKYIRDGVFDSSVVDKQLGVMPILKTILDSTEETIVAPPIEDATISPDATIPRPTTAQMNSVSTKHWWNDWLKWLGIGTAGAGATQQTLGSIDLDTARQSADFISHIVKTVGALGVIAVGVGVIAYAIMQSKKMKDDVQEGRATPSGESNVN